jgi:hypothetical protein
MKNKLVFMFMFFFFNIANAFLVQGYDVSKAWEGAQVYVPSEFLVKSTDNIKVDSPLPVVIFLHGCGGINDHEKNGHLF